jgi:HPt (histidine-containing phosphotransfer) domain-containing protein
MPATPDLEHLPVVSEFAADPDYRELLEIFVSAMPERAAGLTAAHRDGDLATLCSRAHQLKGAAGGYGFPELTKLAASLERACASDDPSVREAALGQMLEYLGRISL